MRGTWLSAAWLALASLSGCSIVIGLGDPIDGGPSSTSGEGGAPDAGPLPKPQQADAIAVGASHACAVVNFGAGSPLNGTVRCWGSNDRGQLGVDPARWAFSAEPLPVVQPDAITFTNVALGASASCAITFDDYLLCWGAVPAEVSSGIHRQEPSPPNPPYVPAQMDFGGPALTSVQSASIGPASGCVAYDVDVVCWGSTSAMSSPPDGGTGGDSGTIPFDSGAFVAPYLVSASVGRAHACGRSTLNGTSDVSCWGANDRAQAGFSPSPTPIPGPASLHLATPSNMGVSQVATGGDSSCALFNNGTVACWGRDDLGQLGYPGPDSQYPESVPLQGVVKQVVMGDAHVCALLDDATVWCWGDNSRGQLGTGNVGGAGIPSKVQKVSTIDGGAPFLKNLVRVQQIAAGGATTCALIDADSNVWCWGANDRGQAGRPVDASGVVPFARAVAW